MLSVTIKGPVKPDANTTSLMEELKLIIPNSEFESENTSGDVQIEIVKDVGPQFIVFRTKEAQLVLKIIEYRPTISLRTAVSITSDFPQLVVSNFKTELGSKVVEFISQLFPFSADSRQVVNFTVEGDFIYLRMYKYSFGEKRPIMQKVGPHLTLRLWRLIEYNEEGEKKVLDFKKFVKNAGLL